jgi:hypothetical protein
MYVHKHLPLDPILSKFNPVNTFTPYFLASKYELYPIIAEPIMQQ